MDYPKETEAVALKKNQRISKYMYNKGGRNHIGELLIIQAIQVFPK